MTFEDVAQNALNEVKDWRRRVHEATARRDSIDDIRALAMRFAKARDDYKECRKWEDRLKLERRFVCSDDADDILHLVDLMSHNL